MHLGPEVFHRLGVGRSKAGRTPSIAYASTHVCGVERRGDGHAGVYGCPFAHLLSARTCYVLQNFNDKNVAAHLILKPRMSISRPHQ